MPIKKAAYKAMRKDKKRHLRNINTKSELKTKVKKFNELISANDIEKARQYLKEVTAKFDKAVTHGIIHRNTASRKKSRLMKMLTKLISKPR